MHPLSLFLTIVLTTVRAQKWCGKNYMSTSPIEPPPADSKFPLPPPSPTPLLALRCAQAVKPYTPSDTLKQSTDPSFVSVLVNTPVVYERISGAEPLSEGKGELQVSVYINNNHITTSHVPLNATKHPVPISLSNLKPHTQPYNLTCTSSFPSSSDPSHTYTYTHSTKFTYLPTPARTYHGSITKMDLRPPHGALLARPPSGRGEYESVFPIGFYTSFDDYLAKNLSIVGELKEAGFTMIHPVPTFANTTALELVLDEMERVGMYIMYDMRGTYMDLTSISAQITTLRTRPNLLLWYTADEPDGWGDPVNATTLAYDAINSASLDAGYHPVSLVLNCADYYFSEYTRGGADIIMQDAYMVGNDVTFSTVWGTECSVVYGDCGCDNCKGRFTDISTRLSTYQYRAFVEGWDLETTWWSVPQAFGNESYWTRYPTAREFLVECVVAINHGASGIVPWIDPTTPEIKASAGVLARALQKRMGGFLMSPRAEFSARRVFGNGNVGEGGGEGVDVGMWSVGREMLVVVANLGYGGVEVSSGDIGVRGGRRVEVVFSEGVAIVEGKFVFEGVGSGAFVFTR